MSHNVRIHGFATPFAGGYNEGRISRFSSKSITTVQAVTAIILYVLLLFSDAEAAHQRRRHGKGSQQNYWKKESLQKRSVNDQLKPIPQSNTEDNHSLSTHIMRTIYLWTKLASRGRFTAIGRFIFNVSICWIMLLSFFFLLFFQLKEILLRTNISLIFCFESVTSIKKIQGYIDF